ncbi:MAG TPA: RluA family pseudouridine synthase [Planctomycetota bacterium]|nr:RluA family pseudouridine synthase [Planctomycetota bacterium]
MRLSVDGSGGRLDRYLVERLEGVSRAIVMKYLKEGRARVNGRRARPGLFVKEGDAIDLPGFDEAAERIRAGRAEGVPAVARVRQPLAVPVLYEDEDMIVVDKPPGLVMHPGEGHEDEGLDLLLRRRYGPSARLVHRIDRDTSGVVVVARGHPQSAARLTEAFREGDAMKTYLALVWGVPEPLSGVVDAPILDRKAPGERPRVAEGGREARTEFETLEAFGILAWVKLRPRTGRRHQIRVHMAHIGHPLAVDRIHAGRRQLKLKDLRPDLPPTWKNPVVLDRQPLHAAELVLRHPRTGEEMRFTAPLPPDLAEVLRLLREIPAG